MGSKCIQHFFIGAYIITSCHQWFLGFSSKLLHILWFGAAEMKPYIYLYTAKSFFGTFFPSNELTSVEKRETHVSRALYTREKKQNSRTLPRSYCCQLVHDFKKSPENYGWREAGIIPDLSSFCESHLLHNSGMVLREVTEYCKKGQKGIEVIIKKDKK